MTTDLYRHFDVEGRLLYVGISISAVARLGGHKVKSDWVDQIATVTIEKFDSRQAAKIGERQAILSEGPLHNKIVPWPAKKVAVLRKKRKVRARPATPGVTRISRQQREHEIRMKALRREAWLVEAIYEILPKGERDDWLVGHDFDVWKAQNPDIFAEAERSIESQTYFNWKRKKFAGLPGQK